MTLDVTTECSIRDAEHRPHDWAPAGSRFAIVIQDRG